MNFSTSSQPIVEVVATSLESCIAAEQGGALRIELCSALSTAGLTPTSALLKMVKQTVQLPIAVMLRPREGDFIYSKQDIKLMEAEMEMCREAGADAFVFGVLNERDEIDRKLLTHLIKQASHVPVVFHRAFDLTPDLKESLNILIDHGCSRVLTSGGASTGNEGKENLFELAEMAVGKIDLMPGGGLREETFEEVLHPLIRHYHLSGRKLVKSPSNASLFEMHRMETDAQTIAHVVQKVKAFFDK
jgi:copper homeostasis protein